MSSWAQQLASGQQLLLSRPNGQPTRAGQFYQLLPALQREPAARARRPQRLHLPPGRHQEAGAQPAAGRQLPRDQAGEELLPRQVDRLPGSHAGADPRAAPERPALRAGDPPARDAGRAGAPERLAGRGAGAPQRHRRRSAQDGRSRRRRRGHGDLRGDLHLRRLAGLGRVDNRVETEVALNRRLGVLRDVSYQLFRGSEILQSAFEQREDRLCVVRQLSELLRLPYEEVYSDFDAICPKNWERKGRDRGRDPGVLRLAQGAAVHRQLPRADARLLRAGRQGAAARGLLHLPRSRLLLPQRRRRVLLRRRGAGPALAAIGGSPPCPSSGSGSSGAERSSPGTSGARTCAWSGQSCWGRGTSRSRDARLGGVAVPAPEGQGRRLRRPRVPRGRGGAREVDDQAGLRLPGPAPRSGRQRGLRRALEGSPGPGRRAGAAAGAAGALHSVRHAHRSRHGRGGPRRPGPPGLLRPEAGPAGFVPGVPPLQDLPGVLPRHEPGEPVLPLCPRDLRLLASAAAAGLRAGEVRSRSIFGSNLFVVVGGVACSSCALEYGRAPRTDVAHPLRVGQRS